MKRGKPYYRWRRALAIGKKRGILLRSSGEYGEDFLHGWTHGGALGYLSKGKIHCSCWLCRKKSYDEKSHSDKMKDCSAAQALVELNLRD